MNRPRHKKKKHDGIRPLKDGDRIRVSRLIASGELVEYAAVYHEDSNGRAIFERIRMAYSARLAEVRALFLAAEDQPVPGFEEWFKISNHPVVINRHTNGRTYTAMRMEQMEVQMICK